MDKGVVELVERMNNILSFVEDADTLRNRLTSLTETIQKILVTIKDCTTSIHEYLDSGAIGMHRSKYCL